MKKKTIAVLLAIACMGTFFGCGAQQQNAAEAQTETATEETRLISDVTEQEESLELQTTELSEQAESVPGSEEETTAAFSDQDVVFGDERSDLYLPHLSGKRVALLTNQCGIVGDEPDGEHILDALLAQNVDVEVVFSPEHGFRGTADAGETVDNAVDEKTGVPLVSLYGNGRTNEPAAADMERFDIVVVDLQDVGLRYFAYYISVLYMMDACAQYDKEMLVLDRPNPNGFYIDGPILKESFYSGVGMLPVPIVYGLTIGELTQMINGEGWLLSGKDACKLTVIPCDHYTHQTTYHLQHMPSPNLKDMHAIYLYPSTCFFENTVVSVGRGTDAPFNLYGSPYLAGVSGYEFSFTPVPMTGAKEPPFEGEVCYGKDLRDIPEEEIWEKHIDLTYLIDTYYAVQQAAPGVSFFGKGSKDRYFLDLLAGTDELRKMIEAGDDAETIKASWKSEIDAFKEQSAPYLLYGSFAE